ncbi:NAD(P)/FAD-dependent oxidoreductase [Flexivirga caeni]|uniref:NAD(P)/FAD-dependent oxidoreductase n=1 Tax=Flexivirga caeni TaxID=2294115 RepID=A0A3M9M971_9MICO|nr:NAD(P)/FAD-dependent oxidoreductase [Flexivirga caeni]RNI21098.1 NAD(P)/FAD-dependent oxidoreductase [Flexivirga caeni]
MQHIEWDVIIAGGGPAGLSAALMLGRSRRRVLVIDSGSPRNRFAAHMHGVLGQEGVAPAELAQRGRAEAADYGVEFRDTVVERVDREPEGVLVTTADGMALHARALVAATGLRDRLPEVAGLAERWGSTVLHCPYCHGWEVRDQRLGVLTTSPVGLHQAELIRQWSDRVVVFTAGLGELGDEAQARLRARGVRLESEPVEQILGEGAAISGVRLRGGRTVSVDAIFTAGAAVARDRYLAHLCLDRTETPFGSFVSTDATGRTSDERVWAVGNIVNPAANVPMSIGAGAFAGGAVNGALVAWDFDAAVREQMPVR